MYITADLLGEFRENGAVKYPVSSSCVEENVLLMSSGQILDCRSLLLTLPLPSLPVNYGGLRNQKACHALRLIMRFLQKLEVEVTQDRLDTPPSGACMPGQASRQTVRAPQPLAGHDIHMLYVCYNMYA